MRTAAWDGSTAELDAVAELYARVFAEPPYHEDPDESRRSISERIRRYADTKAAFRLILAWDGNDLAGFVLGMGISDGDWWRDRIAGLVADDVRRTSLRDECFCVAELAVAPAHRRSGVATALLTAVLDGVPYKTAVLGCQAAALPARRFYAREGWQEVATGLRIGDSPEQCVLAKTIG